MMKSIQTIITLSLIVLLSGISSEAFAQRTSRVSDWQKMQLLRRIETRTETFRRSLNQTSDRSRYEGTTREAGINRYLSDFTVATARLRATFNSRGDVSADVEEVLNRGWAINNFVKTNRLSYTAQREWNYLRSDLRMLASYYNIAWRWDDISYNPYPDNSEYPNNPSPGGSRNSNNHLTGTYTLDESRSDDVHAILTRVTRGQSPEEAERIHAALERRLAPPEQIAIERTGRRIAMMSTVAPQVTFDADGREQIETRQNGRTVRTVATLMGDRLTINSTGDRGSDYFVSFESIEYGRALRVTRRFYTERLNTPVEAVSVYRKTANTAQFDVYAGNRDNPYPRDDRDNRNPGDDRDNRNPRDDRDNRNPNSRTGRYVIPNETTLIATLNDDLTSRQTRSGDRFTMTVTSPSQYEGAILEGTVSKVERSGRVSGRPELVLNFQSVRLRNGTTAEFAGFIDQVRTVDGEAVKVDNEGSVKDDDSQTTKTVTRSGIGAAIGAIIGGITGGGQGAAIGAVVGAGAGAGTVLVQGREDINLMRGTQFTIRSSAPSNIAR